MGRAVGPFSATLTALFPQPHPQQRPTLEEIRISMVSATPERRLWAAYWASWSSYILLLVSLGVAGLVAGTPTVLLVFALAPLLLFVPGMIRRSHRSFSYLCFVALLYFTVIVTNLFKPDRSWLDAVALAAVMILFVAAMLCSRWLQRRPSSLVRKELPVHEQK